MVRRVSLLFILTVGFLRPAAAQNLIDMYRAARVEAQAERLAEQYGHKLKARSLGRIPTSMDSLMSWNQPAERVPTHTMPEPTNQFIGAEWRPIRRLQRGWFEDRYGRVQWSYLGNHAFTPLDTSMTKVLRARLEARFGSPTRRLQDVLSEGDTDPKEYIQFEYWFVVNDSIPVIVMDTGGPYDRGVVLATEEKYRPVLSDIRHSLAAEVTASDSLAAYSEYYYDADLDTWYFTGYDGQTFFAKTIPEPKHLTRRVRHASRR